MCQPYGFAGDSHRQQRTRPSQSRQRTAQPHDGQGLAVRIPHWLGGCVFGFLLGVFMLAP